MSIAEAVEQSTLFRHHAATQPQVEFWVDEGYDEEGFAYAWIVSRFGEAAVRNLEYVRFRDGRLQRRTYDEEGDDLWVDTD